MPKQHWKRLINPDYLGAYSLDNGQNGYTDITATIASVKVENVTGADGKKEDCMVMRFKETRIGAVDMKPMIVNVTNAKMLEKLFKTPYVEDWANRRITIGVESVKAFGDVVDALRIRKTIPREQGVVKCLDCGGEIVAAGGMNAAQVVAYARKRFGADLCAGCMKKRDESKKAAEKKTEPTEQTEPEQTDHIADADKMVSTEPEQTELSEFEKAMKENEQ